MGLDTPSAAVAAGAALVLILYLIGITALAIHAMQASTSTRGAPSELAADAKWTANFDYSFTRFVYLSLASAAIIVVGVVLVERWQ